MAIFYVRYKSRTNVSIRKKKLPDIWMALLGNFVIQRAPDGVNSEPFKYKFLIAVLPHKLVVSIPVLHTNL